MLRTMSTNFLRVNRSLLSPLSLDAVKYNIEHSILNQNEQFSFSLWPTHCTYSNSLTQFRVRSIYSGSSALLKGIQESIDSNSEKEPRKVESAWTFSKGREQTEAGFYHNVLENSSAYSGTIYSRKDDPKFLETYTFNDKKYKDIIETINWHEKSPSYIITSFISLGVYLSRKQNMTIEDEQFAPLLSAVVNNLNTSTEEQLIDCLIALKYWPLLESFKGPHVLKVWKELDNVCLNRYLDWSIDKILFMLDLWYHLGLIRNSYYAYKALNKISRKTEEFTAAQMLQSLFYMSVKRNINPSIAIREYEYYIQQYITKLSIEEIGIFALAFFKTKTSILDKKLLLYVMQRTVEEAETMHPLVITSISKIVRLSHKPDIGFTANDMVEKVMQKRKDSLPLLPTMHLVHIGTQIQFYNEEVLTKLAEKFCKDPSEARLKEMERMAFFFSLYNFIPPSTPDILHMIVEQINKPIREQEASHYPFVLLSLLNYLGILRVFPEKQIKEAINEDSLNKIYGHKFNIPQQVLMVDYNRVLEGPAGSEHLLSPEMKEYLARRYSLYIPDETRRIKTEFDKLLFEVLKFTRELLGEENYLATYTLPHHPRADILFRLNEHGNPMPIPEEMKNAPQFDDIHRPIGPGKWYCAMIGGRNMYMHNVPRLVGEQATKLRQLQSLGYTTVLLPSYYWKKEEDKMAYLKLKFFADYVKNK